MKSYGGLKSGLPFLPHNIVITSFNMAVICLGTVRK